MSEHNQSQPSAAPSAATEPGRAPGFWRHPATIGVAAGLGVLLLGGAGAAVAFGLLGTDGDGAQPGPTVAASPTPSLTPSVTPTPTPEVTIQTGPTPADAEAIAAAISAAIGAVDGRGAAEIEVRRDGWQVEVQRADGTEAEVLVGRDGSTRVVDEDDDGDDPLIDVAQLPELVRIALATAGGGTIQQITTDDDRGEYYEVEVRLANGAEVDIDLDAALNVTDVDWDD